MYLEVRLVLGVILKDVTRGRISSGYPPPPTGTPSTLIKIFFSFFPQATYELCCDMIDVTIDISSIYGHKVDNQNNNNKQIQHQNRPIGFDQDTSAMIMLRTRQVIFLRQINVYLALVAVIKEDNFEKQGLIDFNFNVFRQV